MSGAPGFEPARYLTQIKGRGGAGDYLEVKWRIVWFRDAHPHGSIYTEPWKIDDAGAVFVATVSYPAWVQGEVDGKKGMPELIQVRATGYGSETPGDFRDYVEKAETKAIGRALAALGFGTQFCIDHELAGDVADAPVRRGNDPPPQPDTGELVSQGQLNYLHGVAEKKHPPDVAAHDWLTAIAWTHFERRSVKHLTAREASDVNRLIAQDRVTDVSMPPPPEQATLDRALTP